MDEIQNLLIKTTELTSDQIIDVLAAIGKKGDIIILKNDGLRHSNNYTVIISSGSSKFGSIRYDASNLSEALKKALRDYVEALERS